MHSYSSFTNNILTHAENLNLLEVYKKTHCQLFLQVYHLKLLQNILPYKFGKTISGLLHQNNMVWTIGQETKQTYSCKISETSEYNNIWRLL